MASKLGWDEVRLPAPVFEGNTIYAQSEVVDVRPSQSRPTMGIVKMRTIGFNSTALPNRIPPHHHGLSARSRATTVPPTTQGKMRDES